MAKRHVSKTQPSQERGSARRAAIIAAIDDASGAMTAEEIHAVATSRVPGLGIATVYRNLKLLLDAGRIEVVILPDGQRRYESAGKNHHHHFQCDDCGKTLCLDGCMLSSSKIKLPAGFQVTDHELTLHGRCPDCRGG